MMAEGLLKRKRLIVPLTLLVFILLLISLLGLIRDHLLMVLFRVWLFAWQHLTHFSTRLLLDLNLYLPTISLTLYSPSFVFISNYPDSLRFPVCSDIFFPVFVMLTRTLLWWLYIEKLTFQFHRRTFVWSLVVSQNKFILAFVWY